MTSATAHTAEVQYKASTPTGIFEQAVAFFVRQGIEEFQPGKLSKGIRENFRRGGVSAATEFAQDHANRVGRQLYREIRLDPELTRNEFGHTDLTPAIADQRIAQKKNAPDLSGNSVEGEVTIES